MASPIVLEETTIPDDEVMESDTSSELICEVCGKPLVYGGRGRKPKRCDEHKRGTSTGTKTSTRGNTSVDAAVNTLDTLYATLTAGFMLFQLTEAATSIANSREYLATQNRMFLSKDPKLVSAINKMGATGGRFGFFAVQVMTLGPVMVTAAGELKERRANRQEPPDGKPIPFAAFAGADE